MFLVFFLWDIECHKNDPITVQKVFFERSSLGNCNHDLYGRYNFISNQSEKLPIFRSNSSFILRFTVLFSLRFVPLTTPLSPQTPPDVLVSRNLISHC